MYVFKRIHLILICFRKQLHHIMYSIHVTNYKQIYKLCTYVQIDNKIIIINILIILVKEQDNSSLYIPCVSYQIYINELRLTIITYIIMLEQFAH